MRFAAGGGARVNVFGNRGGSTKLMARTCGMVAERVDHVAAAVDEVYDSFGQGRFSRRVQRGDALIEERARRVSE